MDVALPSRLKDSRVLVVVCAEASGSGGWIIYVFLYQVYRCGIKRYKMLGYSVTRQVNYCNCHDNFRANQRWLGFDDFGQSAKIRGKETPEELKRGREEV